MASARVWAPGARRVSLAVGTGKADLRALGGGWWTSETNALRHREEYSFVLDDGEPLPDPRSPWQPEGPHGPSRWVDHSLFDWSDDDWRAPGLADAIFYEMHVGTFTPQGTFEGVIGKLPYLRDLGVTHLELMPVNTFPGRRGWGYDGVNLYAPHHHYGGPDGLKQLVDAAHLAGLAVVLDVVYNHFGPDGNYLPRFGPYLTERYSTPWGAAVNLDGPGSHEVRRFFVDNALMWLRDYHLDGLRIDAVHAFVDLSAVHFLEQLSVAVDGLEQDTGRDLLLIAESDLNDPRVVRPLDEHGHGMDAQWSDDLHHALHVTLTGERDGYYADFAGIEDLGQALRVVYVYEGRHSVARDRNHGRPVGSMPRHRVLAYAQNHDQTGNRALGERLGQLVGADALRVAAAVVLLGPHVPLLFMGEEWGAETPFQYFTDHQDPELARAVTEGRTHEFDAFGWDPSQVPDPQASETFARSRLDWSEPERESHASLLDWHRRLIAARRSFTDLAAGAIPRVRWSAREQWLLIERGATLVAANLSPAERSIELPHGDWLPELASTTAVRLHDGRLSAPPMSAVLLIGARSR